MIATSWLSGISRFRQVIICPLNSLTFLLHLCDIQVADFQSPLLQNIILDFLIDDFTFCSGQIKLVHILFHINMFTSFKFGKQRTCLHMERAVTKYDSLNLSNLTVLGNMSTNLLTIGQGYR